MHHLWFCLGAGKETCGYQYDAFTSGRIYDKINHSFESVADKFFEMTQAALEESIRSEMSYVFNAGKSRAFDSAQEGRFGSIREDEDLIGERALRALSYYLKKYNPSIRRNIAPEKAPIEWAKVAFLWDGWSDVYCGPKWSNACDVYLNSLKIDSLKKKISWIDNCLDMYHNSGPLLDKTSFAVISHNGDLDVRAELRHWGEAVETQGRFECHVSWDDGLKKIKFYDSVYPLSSKTRNLLTRYLNKI